MHADVLLSLIDVTGLNPRKTFDERALGELAESIRAHGVLQPVLVRPVGQRYQLVAGERRLRASRLAGLEAIPAVVRELDDKQLLEVMVIENLQRADVDPIEEAEGYRQLVETHGYQVDELAARLGKSRAYVYARLRLCELPAEVRDLVAAGRLPITTAQLVMQIPDPAKRIEAAEEMAGNGDDRWDQPPMTLAQARRLVRDEYLRQLHHARWDVGDSNLVPSAGACTACQKRTSAAPELWSDGHVMDDSCLDHDCWKAKAAAHAAGVIAAAGERGLEVLQGAAAKKALAHGGTHVPLNARCQEDIQSRDYRKLLGKKGVEAAGAAVVIDDDGEPVEVVNRKQAQEILESKYEWARGRPMGSGQDSSVRDQEAKRRAELAVRNTAARAAIAQLVECAEVPEQPDLVWSFVARALADQGHHAVGMEVCKRRGIEVEKNGGGWRARQALVDAVERMDENQARGLVIELLASHLLENTWGDMKIAKDDPLRLACGVYNVDLEAALKAAKAEQAAKAKKKAAKKAPAKTAKKARTKKTPDAGGAA